MNVKEQIIELTSQRNHLCELLKSRLDSISFDTEIVSVANEIELINKELKELYNKQ